MRAAACLSFQFITRGEVTDRNTRSHHYLNIPLFKSTSGQRTFYFRTVSLWNNIETSLKLYDSVVNFKNKLKHNLLQ